jgi:Major Facilitator Superfamily
MSAGSLAGAIPAGKLIQKYGLRSILLLCIVFAVAVFSARALWVGYPIQLGLAFLSGISLSVWAVCLSPSIAQLTTERQRPFAFSLFFSLGIGVGAIAGLAGGRLPGWLAGAPPLFHAVQPERAVLLLSCGLVGLSLWPAATLRFAGADLPTRATPFLSPFLLRFLPAIAVWSLVTGSFSPLANVYFVHYVRLSLPQIGTIFSLSQLVQVFAVLAAPFIFRRWGLVSGIVGMQCATALFLSSLAIFHSPLLAGGAYVGFTAVQYMNEPGTYSLLMNNVPAEQQAGASASSSLVIAAMEVIAAALAGEVFAKYGYPIGLNGIAMIAVAAAILFWMLLGRRHSTRNSGELPKNQHSGTLEMPPD